MRASLLIVGVTALALFDHTASAGVWVFGDSNVDTGWFKTSPFSGNPKYDFDLANASLYDIGKPTNNPGPISVEVLAALLRTTAHPANQGGTNYASSGAKNSNANTPLNGGFPNAVPTAAQMANYHRRHVPAPNDLFVINSGANDIGYALSTLSGLTGAAQAAYIEGQASILAKTIKGLQLAGAVHIIVVNQPESFGDPAQMAARRLYNLALTKALVADRVAYAWGDANGVRKDIVANKFAFDIIYTSDSPDKTACPLPNPVLAITTAWALLCSAKSPVTQPTSFAAHTLFADDGHWATRGQEVLGSYYYCLVKAVWPQLVPPQFPFPPPLKLPIACSMFSEFQSRTLPAP
jgi:phospholipase/lecithinase/hemolysin